MLIGPSCSEQGGPYDVKDYVREEMCQHRRFQTARPVEIAKRQGGYPVQHDGGEYDERRDGQH